MASLGLSKITNSGRRFAVAASRAYLPAGRLYYAGVSGLSLVFAAAISPNLSTVGEYIYQIGFASAFATVAGLGLDRIMARRVAAGSIRVGLPSTVVAFRIYFAVFIISLSAGVGVAAGQLLVFLVCGAFIVSRMIYADLEAVWIGARLGDKSLFLALLTNGSLTGLGIILGSLSSSASMILISTSGNVVGSVILLSRKRLRRLQLPTPGLVSEASGIALSLVLAVIYGRVDLLILAALGSPIESVALYGIVTRIFDAVALIRGSIAQEEARSIASVRIRTRAKRLRLLAVRVQTVALFVSTLGIAALWLSNQMRLEIDFASNSRELGLMFVALPLFVSHLPTTAMIYSDRRSHRLFMGSLITCVSSVVIKWLLISTWGMSGAILAIGLVELVSALVFYFLYWSNARSWRSSFTVLAPALGGLLLLGLSLSIL